MGFSEIFPRKIGKLDFLELILDEKIRGLSPRVCGPPLAQSIIDRPWTGGPSSLELGLRPLKGASQGAEDGETGLGNPLRASSEDGSGEVAGR
jgi:hypothetical protein